MRAKLLPESPLDRDSGLAAAKQISEQACRELVERILASQDFGKAAKLRAFLRYAVDQKFLGHPEALTEVQIGHRVLDRAENYNPGEDSIVRTQARTLRQKLERYFLTDGRSERLILELPKGSYAPVFRLREAAQESETGESKPQPNQFGPVLFSLFFVTAIGIAAFYIPRRMTNSQGTLENKLAFESADPVLDGKFAAARDRALASVHSSAAIGSWYDAPGGETGFCPRDLAHQSSGASALGLNPETYNMITAFAKTISASRDWCGFWEVTARGTPYPVDYTNDRHFRYCLPANFDQLQACYRQYLWTGDEAYLKDPTLLNFYRRTVNDYVRTWDKDGDGIMESSPENGVRGIPSYLQHEPRAATGGDLVAFQHAGYQAYAALLRGKNLESQAGIFEKKAQALKETFNQQWWDGSAKHFYSARLADGSFYSDYIAESNIYPLLLHLTEPGVKTEGALDQMEAHTPGNTQMRSYIPQVLFAYGRNSAGYKALLDISPVEILRNSKAGFQSEPAFAAIDSVVEGLMGISVDMPRHQVTTQSHLPPELEWAHLKTISIGPNVITVSHDAEGSSLINQSGPPLHWRAEFLQSNPQLNVQLSLDNRPSTFSVGSDENGRTIVFTEVTVNTGQTHEIHVQHQFGSTPPAP